MFIIITIMIMIIIMIIIIIIIIIITTTTYYSLHSVCTRCVLSRTWVDVLPKALAWLISCIYSFSMEAGLWWDSLEHQSLISPSRKSIAVL